MNVSGRRKSRKTLFRVTFVSSVSWRYSPAFQAGFVTYLAEIKGEVEKETVQELAKVTEREVVPLQDKEGTDSKQKKKF